MAAADLAFGSGHGLVSAQVFAVFQLAARVLRAANWFFTPTITHMLKVRRNLIPILLLAAGCTPAATKSSGARPDSYVYPEQSWTTIDSPESAGWSSAGLERVRQKLATMSTTGMMAVVGGRVL